MVKYSASALKKMAVQGFSYAVVLRCIMGGEAALSAFLLKEFGEVVAGEFTATIGMKSFDFCPMLSLCPGCEGLVGIEGLILGA